MQFLSRLLFQVTADCPRVVAPLNMAPEDWPGGLLPPLGELDGEEPFARVYAIWNESGLYIASDIPRGGRLVGNRQRPDSGDCLQLWIDTSPEEGRRRADRRCYHFIILPQVPGRDEPMAWQQHIHRARGRPPLCDPQQIRATVNQEEESYQMLVGLRTPECLDFAPQCGMEVGFNYLLNDTSLGRQLWSCPHHADYAKDPSCWGRLHLVE